MVRNRAEAEAVIEKHGQRHTKGMKGEARAELKDALNYLARLDLGQATESPTPKKRTRAKKG